MSIAAPFPAPFPASFPANQRHRSTANARRPANLPLRLTIRGRVLLLVATILVLFTLVVAAGGFTAEATGEVPGPGAGPVAAVVVVQKGESLWSIAQQVAPGHDPREIVSRIRDLNGLADALVIPGQSLVVPVVN